MQRLNYAIGNKAVVNLPFTIKILMVVDGDFGGTSVIQFNDMEGDIMNGSPPFGVGYIINILRNYSPDHVNFEVSLATREADSTDSSYGEVMKNFRFDQQEEMETLTINQYDEIWLFGFNGDNCNQFLCLSEDEQDALANWMDNGGGILAMGDHADLGAAMCKDIKRVRYMRRWTRDQGVPPAGGKDRHDTNQPANQMQKWGAVFMPFCNQSDNILQPLYSDSYNPHPILALPGGGTLDRFPDHPHEGWVYDSNEGIDHQKNDDFPNSSQPKAIAWVETFIQDQTNREKGDLNFKRFGALGVYDGHEHEVGRIVVDSTWHHWFNVNLVGMKQAGDQENYNNYKAFVFNVACWLAPQALQKKMYFRAIWHTLYTSDVIIEHYTKDCSGTYKAIQGVLKTFVSQSFRKEWLSLWYPKELLSPDKESRNSLSNAWSPYTRPHWELLEAELLQGIIQVLRPLILEVITNKRTHVEEQDLTSLFEEGASKGAKNAMTSWKQAISQQRKMQETCASKIGNNQA